MQYTEEQKKAAIQAYIANGKNAAKTVRELGYPSIPGLIKWYDRYRPVERLGVRHKKISINKI